jgi:hypothetical protein
MGGVATIRRFYTVGVFLCPATAVGLGGKPLHAGHLKATAVRFHTWDIPHVKDDVNAHGSC